MDFPSSFLPFFSFFTSQHTIFWDMGRKDLIWLDHDRHLGRNFERTLSASGILGFLFGNLLQASLWEHGWVFFALSSTSLVEWIVQTFLGISSEIWKLFQTVLSSSAFLTALTCSWVTTHHFPSLGLFFCLLHVAGKFHVVSMLDKWQLGCGSVCYCMIGTGLIVHRDKGCADGTAHVTDTNFTNFFGLTFASLD